MMIALTDLVKPKANVFKATPGKSQTLKMPTLLVGAWSLLVCYDLP